MNWGLGLNINILVCLLVCHSVPSKEVPLNTDDTDDTDVTVDTDHTDDTDDTDFTESTESTESI